MFEVWNRGIDLIYLTDITILSIIFSTKKAANQRHQEKILVAHNLKNQLYNMNTKRKAFMIIQYYKSLKALNVIEVTLGGILRFGLLVLFWLYFIKALDTVSDSEVNDESQKETNSCSYK